jgi:hypothetical protein
VGVKAGEPNLRWTAAGPLGGIDVRRDDTGMWHVTYAGISRCSSSSLVEALGEACSASRDAAWLRAVETNILAAAAGTA